MAYQPLVPGSVAESDACPTANQEVVGSRLRSGTIISFRLIMKSFLPSVDSRREVVSYLRKNVHWVLVHRLVGLSLPREKCGCYTSSVVFNTYDVRLASHAGAAWSKTPRLCIFSNTLYIVKPLYTDIRYNDKIRYNDNFNGTIP